MLDISKFSELKMSKNTEAYLKALYSITTSSGDISTNEISRRLGVAPSSVTVMLKKLDSKGYVTYSPYQGAALTKAGIRSGEKATRKQRLLECFLYDILKMDKDKVHNQACEMEHSIDDETEWALCKFLKHPDKSSDDQELIPPCDLQFSSCEECQKRGDKSFEKIEKRRVDLVNVSTLKEPGTYQVAFIRGNTKLLRRLSDLGLIEGSRLEIIRNASSKTPIEIAVGGLKDTLSRDIALSIFVEKTEKDKMVLQETLSLVNKRLEERNRQNNIINEMRGLLQSCSNIREMPPIISLSMTKLVPDAEGALFLMNNSRTYLQPVAMWGDFPQKQDETVFKPDDCWGLRRGRIYEVEDIKIDPICPHVKQPNFKPYMCIPLIAKGDILGSLHLRIRSSQSTDSSNSIADFKEPVVNFAEYLSLSIANIRLWENLTDQSIRDPLTGLFNRRYMEDSIQGEILRASKNQTKTGLVMVDIDHFKDFNDSYGHEAGDELLIKLADFFKFEIRGSDIVCRYGGEEFVLILPDSSIDGTYKRAEHIREKVKNLNVYFRGQILPSVTLSMGIAIYPDSGKGLDELIQAADTALYKAKQQGRDKTII
jgi:diguanylate cyclase (GGDEF)-like protein